MQKLRNVGVSRIRRGVGGQQNGRVCKISENPALSAAANPAFRNSLIIRWLRKALCFVPLIGTKHETDGPVFLRLYLSRESWLNPR